ncbi:hypothetical protein [Nocardioides lijunqiniae]|uniref:hypothetical protein n=1 Tax=Nocardioides lijunqiniae TaxID=2760832 RepID=UPI0018786457|nr:hypothetical protein [Nocardioides lijunqiniae]
MVDARPATMNRPGRAAVLESLAGVLRACFFATMVFVAFFMRHDETATGNRVFLLVLGLLVAAVGLWQVVESVRAVRRITKRK